MRPSDETSYMVTVAASVLDSYPDTTEVVTLFQCETQPLMVEFRLIGRRTQQVYTLGKEEKSIQSNYGKKLSTETTGSVASLHQQ